MLALLASSTAVLVFVTGILALKISCGKLYVLKYAAVALSTCAGLWAMLAGLVSGACHSPADWCMAYSFYHIARNVAFILFHIAVTKDAIFFRECEKRECPWKTNY